MTKKISVYRAYHEAAIAYHDCVIALLALGDVEAAKAYPSIVEHLQAARQDRKAEIDAMRPLHKDWLKLNELEYVQVFIRPIEDENRDLCLRKIERLHEEEASGQ